MHVNLRLVNVLYKKMPTEIPLKNFVNSFPPSMMKTDSCSTVKVINILWVG